MSETNGNITALVETLAEEAARSAAARSLPEATYRLQLHAGFTFTDACRIVPYLHELGVTHCYASPYLKARSGSMHGYDITHHGELNPEIGGAREYAAWTGALHDNGMGQILDIVPNHMAVTGNDNRWWNDVLENGPASPYAVFFDIDWSASSRPEMHGRVLVPILGDPYGKVLEAGQLRLQYELGEFSIHYYEHRFPLAPQSYGVVLGQCVEELERLLGADSPTNAEFQSILTASKNLPARTETDPARLGEHHREKEVIKRRLATLISDNPPVLALLTRTLEVINGRPGEPRTFDFLEKLLDLQAYRLAFWRVASDEINYRRFFDVNELAALSMERPEVFAAAHELILRLVREGSVFGLRVDHPDGLYDPEEYLGRLQMEFLVGAARALYEKNSAYNAFEWPLLEEPLRARFGQFLRPEEDRPAKPFYVVVEKILSPGEELPKSWPTYGTTGYEFLNAINGLFVEAQSAAAFSRIYQEWVKDDTSFLETVYQKKILILQIALSSELQMLSRQLDRLAQRRRWSRDFTALSIRRALREVIACFPVYRSYITGPQIAEADRRYIRAAIRRAMVRNPAQSAALFHFIRDTLLLLPFREEPVEPEYQAEQRRFVGKFQQVTSPVTAKGVEDTTFYVYNRLLSLNEVGGNPDQFGLSSASLHRSLQERRSRFPWALSATSTHDTKRSEDTRARLNVISEMPEQWGEALKRWGRLNENHRATVDEEKVPDANEEYFFYQTLLGAWPLEPCSAEDFDRFRKRIQEYMLKALHEAKVHSSWINPNTEYDEAVLKFVERVLDPDAGRAFLDDFRRLQGVVSRFGMFNSVAQTLLKITAPGTPDTYQGTELWDFSLVDPDNRRPVDYGLRERLLGELKGKWNQADGPRSLARELIDHMEDGRIKLHVTWRALGCRKTNPGLFSLGDYTPLEAAGPGADHVFAFKRRLGDAEAFVVVPRFLAHMQRNSPPCWDSAVFENTVLSIPGDPERRSWRSAFTDERLDSSENQLLVSRALESFPVGLYIRT